MGPGAPGRDRGTGIEREEGVAIAERPKTRRPSLYRVLLHNDDFTSMAETRIERVTVDAEAAGYPLLLTMEPE
jgi:ATP-dependent Clp protease adapter protein ClpS